MEQPTSAIRVKYMAMCRVERVMFIKGLRRKIKFIGKAKSGN